MTDLYTGGELYENIAQKANGSASGCFSEDEAAMILRQVLVAVSHLHINDIVHRYLKPENCVFESNVKDSPIKIIDFGLARRYYQNSFEPYMSAIVGTPLFIAPEVLRKKYDKLCDLWSVGVIAFVLICGYAPFNGRNNKEVHDAVKRGKFQFQSKYWKGVSKEAKDFISRLLRTNPKKRMTIEQALNHYWMLKHHGVTLKRGHKKRRFSVSSS